MKRKDNSGYTSIYRIDAFSNAPEFDNRFERKKEKRKQKKTWNHEPYIAKGTGISSKICSCEPGTVQNVPRQDVDSSRKQLFLQQKAITK